jgi:hypothetical protein
VGGQGAPRRRPSPGARPGPRRGCPALSCFWNAGAQGRASRGLSAPARAQPSPSRPCSVARPRNGEPRRSSLPAPRLPLTRQERGGQQQPVEHRAEHVRLHPRRPGAGPGSRRRGAKGRRGDSGTDAPWRSGRVSARAARHGQDPRLDHGDPRAAASFLGRGPAVPTAGARARSVVRLPAAERSAAHGGRAGPDGGSALPSLRPPARPPAGLYKLGPPPSPACPPPRFPRRPGAPRLPLRCPAPPRARRPSRRWRALRPRDTPAPRAPGEDPRPPGSLALPLGVWVRWAGTLLPGLLGQGQYIKASWGPAFPQLHPRAIAPRVARVPFALLRETLGHSAPWGLWVAPSSRLRVWRPR